MSTKKKKTAKKKVILQKKKVLKKVLKKVVKKKSLPKIKILTEQELFNKVFTHLLTQKEQSMDSKGLCLYRGPKGLKCAIGVLIPDNEYKKTVESLSVIDLNHEVQLACGLDESNIDLAQELQAIHDGDSPSQWRYSLETLAKNWALKMPSKI